LVRDDALVLDLRGLVSVGYGFVKAMISFGNDLRWFVAVEGVVGVVIEVEGVR
jgi:hypothetical protein